MSFRCQAVIDYMSLQHNLRQVREVAPQSKVLAMIKANAYGHGLLSTAKALTEADALGVARMHEAIQLRQAGVKARIVLMNGIDQQQDINLLQRHRLDCVIHTLWQIGLFEQAKLPMPCVWLKIDTGMHRLGVHPEEFPEAYQRLHRLQPEAERLILMSHLASAERLDDPATAAQQQCFEALTAGLNHPRSLANSAAIMAHQGTHYDWVRPGIMLYGITPFSPGETPPLSLQPVMTLRAKLIAIRQLAQGAAVGYNGCYRCPEAMPVGILAAGYGDGYPRYIRDNTPVLLQGQRAAILGRVSMDMLAIDLRQVPTASVGQYATLWGKGLPIETIAQQANTSPYELISGVTVRVDYQPEI